MIVKYCREMPCGSLNLDDTAWTKLRLSVRNWNYWRSKWLDKISEW